MQKDIKLIAISLTMLLKDLQTTEMNLPIVTGKKGQSASIKRRKIKIEAEAEAKKRRNIVVVKKEKDIDQGQDQNNRIPRKGSEETKKRSIKIDQEGIEEVKVMKDKKDSA